MPVKVMPDPSLAVPLVVWSQQSTNPACGLGAALAGSLVAGPGVIGIGLDEDAADVGDAAASRASGLLVQPVSMDTARRKAPVRAALRV